MDASARKSQDLERFEALNKAIPDPEIHETIMRAWQLHKRKQREQRESEMQERYEAMINAIEELKEASPYLYSEAVEKNKFNTVRGTKGDQGRKASVEGRIPGLFPRQMQVLRQ
jgi:large subunit ribosomal protein L40